MRKRAVFSLVLMFALCLACGNTPNGKSGHHIYIEIPRQARMVIVEGTRWGTTDTLLLIVDSLTIDAVIVDMPKFQHDAEWKAQMEVMPEVEVCKVYPCAVWFEPYDSASLKPLSWEESR